MEFQNDAIRAIERFDSAVGAQLSPDQKRRDSYQLIYNYQTFASEVHRRLEEISLSSYDRQFLITTMVLILVLDLLAVVSFAPFNHSVNRYRNEVLSLFCTIPHSKLLFIAQIYQK